MTERKLPQSSKSQNIGHRANKSLIAQIPDNWREKSLDGDSDFGIDYVIQVLNENSEAYSSFYLQLKGTESIDFVEGGVEISFSMDSSALKFYNHNEPATMLAIADMSSAARAADCRIYYKWLDDEYLEEIKKRIEDKKSVNVRIPVHQVLNEELDVLPYIKERIDLKVGVGALSRAAKTHGRVPNQVFSDFANYAEKKPVAFDLADDKSGSPWIENPKGSTPELLREVDILISSNKLGEASDLIEKAKGASSNYSKHELSELKSLEGRLLILQGREEQGSQLLQEAFFNYGEERYKVQYYESLFCTDKIHEDKTQKQILAEVSRDNLKECIIRGKCLAIMGDESALDEIANHDYDETLITRLLLHTILGNEDLLGELLENINVDKFNKKQLYTYNCLAARYYFSKGVSPHSDESNGERLLAPAWGYNDFDYQSLETSLGHTRNALKLAAELGYPYDISVVIDFAGPLFSFFSVADELIEFVTNMGNERERWAQSASRVLPLFFNSGDYEGVLKILDAQDHVDPEAVWMRIASKYYLGAKRDVVNLIKENRNIINDEDMVEPGAILAMGAMCAYDILDNEAEVDFLDSISKLSNGAEVTIVYDFVKASSQGPYSKDIALNILIEEFVKSDSLIIAQQLVSCLDNNNLKHAEVAIHCCDLISQERRLSPKETKTLAFSYLKTEQWEKLKKICEDFEPHQQSDEDEDFWALMLSSAYDRLGSPQEALNILDAAIRKNHYSGQRAQYFCELCMRLGLTDTAIIKIEALLESEKKESLTSTLRTLVFVYTSDSKYHERIPAVVERLSLTVNKENEQEEASFLFTCVNLIQMGIVRAGDAIIPLFQKRAGAFFDRFPESVYFRRIELDDSNPSGLIEQVKMLAGITDESNAERVKIRRQIRSRKLPVPYFMLNRFLPDIRDLFSSWSRQKNYAECTSEYKIFRNPHNNKTLNGHFNKILFDQTSLLVLSEIGILDLVLDLIPDIFMVRDDYEQIVELSHPIFGSLSSWLPEKIKTSLSSRLSKIKFLTLPNGEDNLLEDIASLIEKDGLVLCTDDFFTSLFVNKPDRTINSDDIILYLSDTGSIDGSQFFDAYTSLGKLGLENVTPPPQSLYLLSDFYISEVLTGNDNADLTQDFLTVIDAATQRLGTDQNIIQWYGSFFSNYLNQGAEEGSVVSLSPLVVRMLFRLKGMSRGDALARWFVYSCYGTDYVELNEYVKCGVWQKEFLDVIKALYGHDWNRKQFFISVSEVICEQNEILSSDIFEKVRFSVIEGTDDFDVLVKTYTDIALQTRINQVKQVN